MHSLQNLKLHVLLSDDTYDLIVDTRYPIYTTSSFLDRAKATKLILRLWNDFGLDSMIECIQVIFQKSRLSNKICTCTVVRKWRDGKCQIDVNVDEEGQDVDVFDPFA